MTAILEELRATSLWELIAAALGLVYLLLAVRRNLWCWLCAFAGSALYLAVFVNEKLYMQALLQVFYLAMAVYGYVEWKRGQSESGDVAIRSWNVSQHAMALLAVVAATVLNGWLLRDTDAAAPYLDSFVAWGSVVTTWMVARRVIENWLYWIVVDGVGAWLFYSRGLLFTTLLFVVYLYIVVRGYIVWRREQSKQPTSVEATLVTTDNVSR